jgi:hypothetical protein
MEAAHFSASDNGDGDAQRYQAVVPSDMLDEQGLLIDRLIGYAFDTLNVSHLDLRITAEASQTCDEGR